jgi:mannobiose 2-epimerase
MIEDEQFQIRKEFENYLQYWVLNMFAKDQRGIFPEMSMVNIPNETADMGSMYLGRIIYGASRGCLLLKTDQYKPLADLAFEMLIEFKNPLGGYYWGRKYNMEWLHDADNVNMAQAFVLYGLAEYVRLKNTPQVNQMIDEQIDFIGSILKDNSDSYYLDGFNEQWARGKTMTRSFATHFHIMEALVKVYENRKDPKINNSIQTLLHIILDRFIDQNNYFCIHRFTEDWHMLPNENWAGHNAECSWVICHAARVINDKKLIKKTEEIAVLMMNEVVESARDKTNGGYANLISENGVHEQNKSWWPQAEVVLGLLNVYKITGDISYKNLAKNQIVYIQKYFVNDLGEWNTGVNQKGEPLQDTPKIFFWKSMYHTVRYYDFMLTDD